VVRPTCVFVFIGSDTRDTTAKGKGPSYAITRCRLW